MSWPEDLQRAEPSEKALLAFLEKSGCSVMNAFSSRSGLPEDRPAVRYAGEDIICPDAFVFTHTASLPRLVSASFNGSLFLDMKGKEEVAKYRKFGIYTTGFDTKKLIGYRKLQDVTRTPVVIVWSHGNKDEIVAATIDELELIKHSESDGIVFFDYNKIPVLCTCEEFGYKWPSKSQP